MKFSTLLILGILFVTNIDASTYSIFSDPFGTYEVTVAEAPIPNLKGQMTVNKVNGEIQVTFTAEGRPRVFNLSNVQLIGDNLTGDYTRGGLTVTLSLQFLGDNQFTGSANLVNNTAASNFTNMELQVSGIKQ